MNSQNNSPNSKQYDTGLVWFRRDLRVDDNAALYHALKRCKKVYAAFVFDKAILDTLPVQDRRVEFIRESLLKLSGDLNQLAHHNKSEIQKSKGLLVCHAFATQEIPALAHSLGVQAVFCNHDYEPLAIARDTTVLGKLANVGIAFHSFKDHVIFERTELLTQQGRPYGIFTPYKNAWLKKLSERTDNFYLKPYPVKAYASAMTQVIANIPLPWQVQIPELAAIGFERTNLKQLKIPTGASGAKSLFEDFFERIDHYHQTRDFPATKGPSYLSVHLRFGTISIRHLASVAYQLSLQGNAGASTWLGELIWRDFYSQILFNYPHVTTKSFKPAYDAIKWEQGAAAKQLFKAWCDGQTGYPIIDAAMMQIRQTGYMHNRLRMIAASFLVKDLGIDWRWGERYFAEHLNDFDLASNNGGWQWASSSGCDAQPYFRIFNPVTQSEKFDADGKFIRRYLPQLAKLNKKIIHQPWLAKPMELQDVQIVLGVDYPKPIVEHALAREKTLTRYAVVKSD